jgi:DNA-binding CsgD family transcriptional regulator
MQIILPDNHPTLARGNELKEMLESKFPNSPLTYFQHCKVHADGALSCVTSRSDWMETCFKLNIRKAYSHINAEVIDKTNYWFLWDHNLFDAPLGLARNEFNIANGICFLERKPDCYYMTAFATNNMVTNALDYYLNNFDTLRNFIQHFRDAKSDLLTELDKKRIILEKPAQDPNKDLLLLDPSLQNTRKTVYFGKRKSYITLQELECIKRLPLGKTAKEIARDLKLSHRTVESYFNRVMTRVGCKNKMDLISLLNQ